MPRQPNKERVQARYYVWLLGTRNGMYYADGRGNTPDLGRHSLGARDRASAIDQLFALDLKKAVELGRADASLLRQDRHALLRLEDGRQRYMAHVGRPVIQGGATPSTVKRYRAVFDKFLRFATGLDVRFWQQVNRDVLTRYNTWLDAEDYSGKTQYIELTVLKQALKWLAAEALLPPASNVALKLRKPTGTRTYCYTQEQVEAIVRHCRTEAGLGWLADVVVALALTGLRISELAALRWTDVKLDRGVIQLIDDSRHARRSERAGARTTKSHRDRALPIHEDLLPILARLPRVPDGRVFHGPHGGKIKPDTVRNVLIRDVLTPLAAKFPATAEGPGILAGRVHGFRHYFCSMSADRNVAEQVLMSWLGHRESEMIRHYYHLRNSESKRQMGLLPSLDNTNFEAGS